ncbi:response regulator, partial [Candidatus Aerophobetes bacterium]|nr:response regulator [Candidatus Aerophobetes bacterium]
IRTPLSTIKGAAYLLNKSSLSEEQRRFCSMIRDSGEHLLRIINDILDLARIEAGQARLEEKELSLKELVEKTVFGFELRAKRKGLELNTIYPSDLPLEIRADEGKLSQVLTNLVDNALKFTQQGKVEVKLEKLADLNIRLQVKDTGIGISEQKLSRIFEKFYQVDGTSRRKYEGTGLGLTIVRELANLMAGKIEARSRLGKGSTFSFTFPYSAAKQRMVQAKDQAKPKTKQQLKKEINILIAEDDDSGYYITKSLLDNYTTSRAVDGREVLEKIREKDYDLVLMDIQMPEMDGLEATRKIREKDSTLPIIALTAKAMKGDRERCLEAGCSDYLSKPIELEELIAKVSQYLPKKARQKEK